MIDDTDLRILHLVQINGRISNAEIARDVEMAPSAVLERIRKLEERGIIRTYSAQLNPQAVGQGLLAFVLVRTDGCAWEAQTAAKLADMPEVQEVHHIAGEDCFLVKIRASDTASLGELLRDCVSALPSVRSTRTTIVLDTVKETLNVDLRDKGQKGRKP